VNTARKTAHALSQHIAIVCCGVAVVEMGCSRQWLADQAGVTRGYLSNVCQGSRILGLDKAIALCATVGLPLADVVEAYEEERS
jgi:transcriptional regulator with XRE-family HTH domain